MATKEQQAALDRTKILLMTKMDVVFFTTLCFSLKHFFCTSIPTACTNGTYIKYNPTWFMSLSPEERLFIMLHETLHCAYLHMIRVGSRSFVRFNIAADHVINLFLISRGYRMPVGMLADPQYSNMTTEQVYDLLPVDTPSNFNTDIELPESDPMETEKELTDLIVRASVSSQMSGDSYGSIPGDIQIFLNRLLKPRLPWQKILSRFMTKFAKTRYTFKRPNRRFLPDHILPGMYGETISNIAIAVDTSGSVTNANFLRFISETHGIIKKLNPDKVTFIQFDTSIKSIDEVKSVKQLMGLKFTGRGGTNSAEVIEWANTNKPTALLIFTDGYFTDYGHRTKSPVIWLIHNHPTFNSEFGKVIHYDIEGNK